MSLLPLQRTPNLSVSDQIWVELRSKILHRQLAPGTRLVELEIAAQMGTSQAPVREALQRLERDGLVERRPRSGTFVTDVSVDEMREIFIVRSVVEELAIRRFIKRCTPAQIEALDRLTERMRGAGRAGDMHTLVDYDMEFHQQIVQWSGHQTLIHAWMPLYMQVERFVVSTHPHHFPNLEAIANTHQPILDALRSADPDAAAACIKEHILLIWPLLDQAGGDANAEGQGVRTAG
jgi:DNA-binding GntR family transcriptional regulator